MHAYKIFPRIENELLLKISFFNKESQRLGDLIDSSEKQNTPCYLPYFQWKYESFLKNQTRNACNLTNTKFDKGSTEALKEDAENVHCPFVHT